MFGFFILHGHDFVEEKVECKKSKIVFSKTQKRTNHFNLSVESLHCTDRSRKSRGKKIQSLGGKTKLQEDWDEEKYSYRKMFTDGIARLSC